MAETSSEPWRTLAVKVIPIPDALSTILTWIRLTHGVFEEQQ